MPEFTVVVDQVQVVTYVVKAGTAEQAFMAVKRGTVPPAGSEGNGWLEGSSILVWEGDNQEDFIEFDQDDEFDWREDEADVGADEEAAPVRPGGEDQRGAPDHPG